MQKKPLSYTSGKVKIDSNLPIFLSESTLKLLGFYKAEMSENKILLKVPLKEEFDHVINFESDEQIVYPDDLARMETKSKLYSNYRYLISQKPKGSIQIKFKIGNEEHNSSILFDFRIFITITSLKRQSTNFLHVDPRQCRAWIRSVCKRLNE